MKDGCSEGAYTCTVLIDGKPTKACVPQTDKLEGKNILTVEGLSDWEKKVYTWAFGEAGSRSVRLLHPWHGDLRQGAAGHEPGSQPGGGGLAIRNNICRCTGYVKIIDGILLAAKCFREEDARGAGDWKVGSRVHRLQTWRKRSPAPANA